MPAFTSGDILSIINKTKKSVYYFLAERPDETEPENVTELYPNEVTDLKGSILLSANKKYVVFVNKHNSWNVTVEVKVEKQ